RCTDVLEPECEPSGHRVQPERVPRRSDFRAPVQHRLRQATVGCVPPRQCPVRRIPRARVHELGHFPVQEYSGWRHSSSAAPRRAVQRVQHRRVDRREQERGIRLPDGRAHEREHVRVAHGRDAERAPYPAGRTLHVLKQELVASIFRWKPRERMYHRVPLIILLWAALALGVQVNPRPPEIPFQSHTIDPGAAETAAVADINHDGRLDIVSGENWYEAPTWTKHRFRDLNFVQQYIDDFSDLPLDVDGDGYPDIVSVSWFAKRI